MDELALLTRHRPDAPPPTDDERATARAAVMAHIAVGGATDTVAGVTDLAPRRRRPPRSVRRVAALVGVAAALVGGLLVAGGSEDAPSPLRDRPATAAEQVRTIATAAAASPFPDVPYVIDVRVDTAIGGDTPSETTYDQRLFQVDPNTTVSDLGGCTSSCSFQGLADFGVPFPADADAATVRQAIDDLVAETRAQTREMSDGEQDEDPAELRISFAVGALEGRTAGPAARAELLRILAESPGLTVEEDVTTAFGHTGTRITIDYGIIERTFVVDPTDGYVLETGTIDLSEVEPPTAGMIGPDGEITRTLVLGPPSAERVTFDRPEEIGDLPDEVEQTVDAIEAGWDAAIAGWGSTESPSQYHCSGGDWATEGFPGISEGWRFMRCWTP